MKMNVLNSQLQPDATDNPDQHGDSAVTTLTAEIVPACSLLGIISGFVAFVAFGQSILPALIAAVFGAMIGLFFACDEEPGQAARTIPRLRK
jgi:hypothetical protein